MASKGSIVVTGANGGLGCAIVHKIAGIQKFSAHHGIYTVRNLAKATSLQSILKASKSHPHEILELELSNMSKVRETAANINAKVAGGEIPRIQALILNAGYREPQGQTQNDDGLDIAFASNYLGHWLLALLLLQSMDTEFGRVVIIGAWAHE